MMITFKKAENLLPHKAEIILKSHIATMPFASLYICPEILDFLSVLEEEHISPILIAIIRMPSHRSKYQTQ